MTVQFGCTWWQGKVRSLLYLIVINYLNKPSECIHLTAIRNDTGLGYTNNKFDKVVILSNTRASKYVMPRHNLHVTKLVIGKIPLEAVKVKHLRIFCNIMSKGHYYYGNLEQQKTNQCWPSNLCVQELDDDERCCKNIDPSNKSLKLWWQARGS